MSKKEIGWGILKWFVIIFSGFFGLVGLIVKELVGSLFFLSLGVFYVLVLDKKFRNDDEFGWSEWSNLSDKEKLKRSLYLPVVSIIGFLLNFIIPSEYVFFFSRLKWAFIWILIFFGSLIQIIYYYNKTH